MSQFSHAVDHYWQRCLAQTAAHSQHNFLSINPHLPEGREIMLLKRDTHAWAVVTPEWATRLALAPHPIHDETEFRQRLAAHGAHLHGADWLHYFTEADQAQLLQETTPAHIRPLSQADQTAFNQFQSQASEADLDAAWVELDHWSVWGAFVGPQLVCAASMYVWPDSPLADTGVLTLPAHRGQGFARDVIRTISRHACQQGLEPQYRCQLDHVSSAAVARAAGMLCYGSWEVLSTDD